MNYNYHSNESELGLSLSQYFTSKGRLFYSYVDVIVAGQSDLYIYNKAPTTKNWCLIGIGVSNNGAELDIITYSIPTITDIGTPISFQRENNIITNINPELKSFLNPTFSDLGNETDRYYLAGSISSGNRSSGGFAFGTPEKFYPPLRNGLIRIDNNDNSEQRVVLRIEWAELEEEDNIKLGFE